VTLAPVSSLWLFSGTKTGTNLYPSQPSTEAHYTNIPADTYNGMAQYGSAGKSFALHSIESPRIAKNNDRSLVDHLLALGGEFIAPVANAEGYCGWLSSATVPTCANGTTSASANPGNSVPGLSVVSNDTGNSIILWDPIAALGVNTGVINLTANDYATDQTGTFTLSNVGADGSEAVWSASAATTDTNWLSIDAPSSGSLAVGAPQTITVRAKPGIAGSGSHKGTITIGGMSQPTSDSLPSTIVTVNFNVTAPPPCQGDGTDNPSQGCPPDPANCKLTPNPASVVIPQKSTLTYHCEHVTSCTLSGGEIPSPIAITPAGTTADGTHQVAPVSNPTVYSLSCQGEATSSAKYNAAVNVQVNVATSGRTETAP
jgi:hypothetical protein